MHNRVGQAACVRCCKNWASWALAILVKALQTNILKAQRQWLCGSHNTVTVPCLVNLYCKMYTGVSGLTSSHCTMTELEKFMS